MENLNWKDRVDGQDDVLANDTNTLAHAIITIINWINNNGNNVNIDLSDYYTKEEITTKLEAEYATKAELLSLEEDVIKNAENLSQKASMSEVEAYIEETILGGAW